MNSNDFLKNVNDYYELREFCSEVGCEYCDFILDNDGLDEEVDEALSEHIQDYGWREVGDLLGDIPTGYEWYRREGSFDYIGLEHSDFEDSKAEVYEWALNNGYFDNNEEEEEYDGVTAPEFCDESGEAPVEGEYFSVSDLMEMRSVTLITIQTTDNSHRVQEEVAAFNRLIDASNLNVIR